MQQHGWTLKNLGWMKHKSYNLSDSTYMTFYLEQTKWSIEWMNEWIHIDINKIRTVTSEGKMEMEIQKGHEGIFWGNGIVLYLNRS